MLIAKEQRQILLNLTDPERITALIPSAKSQTIKGRQIVALPHTDEVVRVLRNLGISAPAPILSYYDWPGQFTPFAHQKETAGFCTLNPRAYVLNGMGSGKTASVLWAFDYLRKQGIVDWALVVSPLSTLERAWADEVFRNFPDMRSAVVHGTPDKRHKVASAPSDIYIINHDGLKSKHLQNLFRAKAGVGLIIVDEIATYRNAATDRWKALNRLVNGNKKEDLAPLPWVWGLTGTPIPNEPTDVWAQCRIVTPGTVPAYYTWFRDLVMSSVAQFKFAAKEGALATAHQAMQPAIRFAREDCIDLPPTTYTDRVVPLSAEQARMYKSMVAHFKAEYEGGVLTAMNAAVKAGKLMQIVCGVAYTDDGEVSIPAQPRIDAVAEVIEQSAAKVIVFVPLTGALHAVAEALAKQFRVVSIHGGTSKPQRDTAFADFQSAGGPRVLVAQPATMAHGLSLTAADTIVWFAPAPSSEVYQQANMRIVRPGQKRNTLIVRMQGSPFERIRYLHLEQRKTAQDSLLELFN